MKFFKAIWSWYPALYVVLLSVALQACSSAADRVDKLTSTSTNISAAQTAAANQSKTLAAMGTAVNGLSSSNVANQKPLLQGQVTDATGQNKQITAALGSAQKSGKGG